MIFSARQVQEKCREQGRDLCLAFIDLTKAFDSVNREALWACLARLGCPPKFVNITRQLHEGMKGCVLFDGEQSGSFNINTGVKQGCVIAPTLFSIFLAAFISLAAVDQAKGVGIIYRTDGELFNMRRLKAKTKVKATSMVDLQYADDCAIAAHTEADLQNTLDAFSEAYKLLGLTVNVTKTKVLFQPAQPLTATAPNIDIEGATLENVDHFAYLPLEVGKHRCRNSTQDQMCVLFIRQAERPSLLRKRLQNSNQDTGLQGCYSHNPLIWLWDMGRLPSPC